MSYSVQLAKETRRKLAEWRLPKEGINAIFRRMDELSEHPSRHLIRVLSSAHVLETDVVYLDPGPPPRHFLIVLSVRTASMKRRCTLSIATGSSMTRAINLLTAPARFLRTKHEYHRPPQAIRPPGRPAPLLRAVAETGLFPRRSVERPGPLLHRDPAAERDRRAAPGPRAQQHAPGHPHPLAADAGVRRPLDARHRPRRHRHAGGGGAAPLRGGEEDPARPRPRGAGPRASGPGRTNTRPAS